MSHIIIKTIAHVRICERALDQKVFRHARRIFVTPVGRYVAYPSNSYSSPHHTTEGAARYLVRRPYTEHGRPRQAHVSQIATTRARLAYLSTVGEGRLSHAAYFAQTRAREPARRQRRIPCEKESEARAHCHPSPPDHHPTLVCARAEQPGAMAHVELPAVGAATRATYMPLWALIISMALTPMRSVRRHAS